MAQHRRACANESPSYDTVNDTHTIASAAGVFYDDPTTTPPARCRSRAAVELSLEQTRSCGLPVMTLDRQNALQATFSYRNDAALGLATSKAYPALVQKWRAGEWEHGVCVEVYDKPNQRVEFYDVKRAGPPPQLM